MQTNVSTPAATEATATAATATDATEATATDAKAAKAAAAKAKREAAKAAKAAKAKAADKPATDNGAAIVSRGLARDASTVLAQATNFEQYSDRDTAYLRFFGTVMRKNNGTATLAQIHEAGKADGKTKRRNPFYAGSAKATDAGAINRLIKAGYIRYSRDGHTLTVTANGATQAAYNGKAKA